MVFFSFVLASALVKGLFAVAPDPFQAAKWAAAARRAGLQFLVLAVPGKGLTGGKWEEFVKTCWDLSSSGFALIPAIETAYEDRREKGVPRNFRVISFGLREWVPIDPSNWWGTHWPLWTKAKATQILSRPWETDQAVVRLCNAIQGAEAVTVTGKGVRRDGTWADYVRRGFRVGPVVVVRGAPPDVLLRTKWALYAFAPSPKEVLKALNYWDGLSCFISNGPVIEDFKVKWEGEGPPWLGPSVKGPRYARPGGWFCATYGEVLTFRVRARSEAPIVEVSVIGNREEKIATARPRGKVVNLWLRWRLVESVHARLKVVDERGREAETSVISIWGYPGMNTQDCLDRNNIFCFWANERAENFRLLDIWSIPGNWWHTLSSTATNSHSPYEYLPQVLRAIEPGCGFGAVLNTEEGRVAAEKSAAGRIYSSPLLTIGYGEGMGAGVRCRSLWFLPQPFFSLGRLDLRSCLVLYIERELEVDRPIKLADHPDEPPLILYSPGTTETMRDCGHKFSRLAIATGGMWRRMERPLPREGFAARKVEVKRGGFVCLYGNNEAAVAYFPLDEASLVSVCSSFYSKKTGAWLVGTLIGPKVDELPPGRPLRSRLIIVVSPPCEARHWDFAERFRRAFVKDGGLYKFELRRGKVLERGYPAVLEAEGGAVEGVFELPWEMEAPLLCEVRGLKGPQALFVHGGRRGWLPVWRGRTWVTLGERRGGRMGFEVRQTPDFGGGGA